MENYDQQRQTGMRRQPSPPGAPGGPGGPGGPPQPQQSSPPPEQGGTEAPSKVIHVRGLPPGTTDGELNHLCATAIGVHPTQVFVFSGKGQALLEFENIQTAAGLLDHFSQQPAILNGKQVYLQYSSHQELELHNHHSHSSHHSSHHSGNTYSSSSSSSGREDVRSGGGHHRHHQQQQHRRHHHHHQQQQQHQQPYLLQVGGGGGGGGGGGREQHPPPSAILLVTILEVRYPVSIENLQTVFSPFGQVLRIVMFMKHQTLKALVEMGSVESATNALHMLDGKDMFMGCCHLRITYSTNTRLLVRQNGPRSRDFTVLADPHQQHQQQHHHHHQHAQQPSQQASPQQQPQPQQQAPPHFYRSGSQHQQQQQAYLYPGAAGSSVYPPPSPVSGSGGGMSHSGGHSPSSPSSNPGAYSDLDGGGLSGGASPVSAPVSRYGGSTIGRGSGGGGSGGFRSSHALQQQQQQHHPSMMGVAMMAAAMSGAADKGTVLLVNNLVPGALTPDHLFMLFGVYGDVMRVKILFNKRDTAMVQLAHPYQAYLAHLHLNHLILYGKELNIGFSRHHEISIPRQDDEPGQRLTKDYSKSPVHRFAGRNQRNAQNIHPPSTVLHISNLYPGATVQELKTLFQEAIADAQLERQLEKNRHLETPPSTDEDASSPSSSSSSSSSAAAVSGSTDSGTSTPRSTTTTDDELTPSEMKKSLSASSSAVAAAAQIRPPIVHFFPSRRRMAFVKCGSLHDAVLALMSLHNHRIKDCYMRVSFSSKNPIQIGEDLEAAEADLRYQEQQQQQQLEQEQDAGEDVADAGEEPSAEEEEEEEQQETLSSAAPAGASPSISLFRNE